MDKNKKIIFSETQWIDIDKLEAGSDNGIKQRPLDIAEMRQRFGKSFDPNLWQDFLCTYAEDKDIYIVYDGQYRYHFLKELIENGECDLPDNKVPCRAIPYSTYGMAKKFGNFYFTQMQSTKRKNLTDDELAVPMLTANHDDETRKYKKCLVEAGLAVHNGRFMAGNEYAMNSLHKKVADKFGRTDLQKQSKEFQKDLQNFLDDQPERVIFKHFKDIVNEAENLDGIHTLELVGSNVIHYSNEDKLAKTVKKIFDLYHEIWGKATKKYYNYIFIKWLVKSLPKNTSLRKYFKDIKAMRTQEPYWRGWIKIDPYAQAIIKEAYGLFLQNKSWSLRDIDIRKQEEKAKKEIEIAKAV